jgi:hypothetical protein
MGWNNIKTDLRETWYEGVELIPVVGSCELGNEPPRFLKSDEFLKPTERLWNSQEGPCSVELDAGSQRPRVILVFMFVIC